MKLTLSRLSFLSLLLFASVALAVASGVHSAFRVQWSDLTPPYSLPWQFNGAHGKPWRGREGSLAAQRREAIHPHIGSLLCGLDFCWNVLCWKMALG